MRKKNIVIIGAGTGGTIMANKLSRTLDLIKWNIIVIDNDEFHYYQPGFLYIPFGKYKIDDVIKPKKKFISSKCNFLIDEVININPNEKKVILKNNNEITYDILIIASGVRLAFEETPGLIDKLWYKDIFDFYSLQGALKLQERLKKWEGGKFVVAISEIPFKCPIAPIEFTCFADEYFAKRRLRSKTEIFLVTPMSAVFTRPIASRKIGNLLENKNIKVVSDFYIERIDNENKKLISYDEKEIEFDLLTIIPVHKGAEFLTNSGLVDDMNFVIVDKYTLQSTIYPEVFAIGDTTNVPTSKAGSVVHFQAEFLIKNILNFIEGKDLNAKYDGHANCFIEVGNGKATLIDFNYDVEPLPGTYPIPFLGPFKLLEFTKINHWGKLFFKWLYWNIILKAIPIPISPQMNLKGKKIK